MTMTMTNSTKIFVGGIPKDVTKIDIYEKVAAYGTVANIYYSKTNDVNSGGWAFVTFKEAEASLKAIEDLHSKYIFPNSHRPLIVKFADSKHNSKDSSNKATNSKNNKQNPNIDTEETQPWLSTSTVTTKPLTHYHNNLKEQTFQNRSQNDMMLQFKTNNSKLQQRQLVTSLFIFHLPPEWTEQDLYRHFKAFGYITNVHVRRDSNGKNRGFGFVTYRNHTSALNAIKMMNGFHVCGKHLKVEFRRGEQRYSKANNMMQNSVIKNSVLQNSLLQNIMMQSNMTQGNVIQNNLMPNNIIPTSPMVMNQPSVLPSTGPLMFINQQPPLSLGQPNISLPYAYTYESMDLEKQTEQNSLPLSRCEETEKDDETT